VEEQGGQRSQRQHGDAVVQVNYGRRPGYGRRESRLPLKPWYSPTGSYLQIHSPEDALACRSALELSVSYTTRTSSPAEPFGYVYQVVSVALVRCSGLTRVGVTRGGN